MPGRILLVDDERPILFAIREYLVLQGYDVDTAEGIPEATALLESGPYDLAIVDFRLSSAEAANGFEVARIARALHPRIRILLLTAYGSPEIEREARYLGIERVLSKPQPLSVIAQIVGELGGHEPTS